MHTNKMIISLLLFTIVIQISWSISSCTYDYNKIYSPASNVATFIQKFKNNNIYGLSFNESAINPYFKNNIFKNWKQDISFFYWNTQNKFYQKYIDENYMLKHNLEIVIVSKFYRILDDNKLKNTYNIYEFKGATYFENSIFEDQTIKVYILKTIDV